MNTSAQRRPYIQAVLVAYLELPDTPARARPPDRRLAGQFFDRGIPLATLRDAFLLAASRRLIRDEQLPPLSPICSLYYFLPVVEELLQRPLPGGYAEYLEGKLCARNQAQGGDGRWKKPLIHTHPAARVQKSSDPGER